MPEIQTSLLLCLGAYSLHILEESVFDWRTWARAVVRLPVTWQDFYVTNAAVVILGSVAVQVAPAMPVVSMAFPGILLLNATFFHVLPFVLTKGRFSPGLITALLLFYPAGIAAFRSAHLSWAGVITAFVFGALLHASPVVFILLRQKSFFVQTED
jgi:hypothetical protein